MQAFRRHLLRRSSILPQLYAWKAVYVVGHLTLVEFGATAYTGLSHSVAAINDLRQVLMAQPRPDVRDLPRRMEIVPHITAVGLCHRPRTKLRAFVFHVPVPLCVVFVPFATHLRPQVLPTCLHVC